MPPFFAKSLPFSFLFLSSLSLRLSPSSLPFPISLLTPQSLPLFLSSHSLPPSVFLSLSYFILYLSLLSSLSFLSSFSCFALSTALSFLVSALFFLSFSSPSFLFHVISLLTSHFLLSVCLFLSLSPMSLSVLFHSFLCFTHSLISCFSSHLSLLSPISLSSSFPPLSLFFFFLSLSLLCCFSFTTISSPLFLLSSSSTPPTLSSISLSLSIYLTDSLLFSLLPFILLFRSLLFCSPLLSLLSIIPIFFFTSLSTPRPLFIPLSLPLSLSFSKVSPYFLSSICLLSVPPFFLYSRLCLRSLSISLSPSFSPLYPSISSLSHLSSSLLIFSYSPKSIFPLPPSICLPRSFLFYPESLRFFLSPFHPSFCSLLSSSLPYFLTLLLQSLQLAFLSYSLQPPYFCLPPFSLFPLSSSSSPSLLPSLPPSIVRWFFFWHLPSALLAASSLLFTVITKMCSDSRLTRLLHILLLKKTGVFFFF
ncbi:hypothetical protein NL108_014345 [Boleophthalmus pectinirostris]|nr:hypothetical protein NL108_014345 [Boleophthalmus pectinirostris]